MTLVASIQCVERGHFSLDEDVTRLLPELRDILVLTGFHKKTGEPILRKSTKPIALRHLLLHTSGLSYDVYNNRLKRWRRSQNEEVHMTNSSLQYRYTTPLLFEPGEGWEYSCGHDWAGQMAERVSGMSLSDYMEKYIWKPLGIKNIGIRLDDRPDMVARIPDMSERPGGRTRFDTALDPTAPVEYYDNQVVSGLQ